MDSQTNQKTPPSGSEWFEHVAKAGCWVVALVPILVLMGVFHVPLKPIVIGSGSWGIGCLLKMLLYHGVIRKLDPTRHSPALIGLANGLASGCSELGIAALAFWYLGELAPAAVIGFGAGIGSFEALVIASVPNLLQGTAVEGKARQLERRIHELPARQRWFYAGVMPVIERLLASMIHVGTRALVYVALSTRTPALLVAPVATFTLVDGLLGYRMLIKSGEPSLRELNRFYLWLSLLAALIFAAGMLGITTFDVPSP